MVTDYIAVDLEMTGLNPKRDRILEIGAVKVLGGEVKDTFSHLVNPKIPVSETVVKLTGISNEMAGLARDIDEVMQEFLAFAGEFTWVGHNVIYDYGFVKQWAVNHNIPLEKRAVDTLKIARKCLVFPEKKSLDSLCMFYHIEREERHRAYMDALAAHRLYEILKKEFYEGRKNCSCPGNFNITEKSRQKLLFPKKTT